MRNFVIVLLVLMVALPVFAQPDIANWSEFSAQPWSAFYDIFASRDGGFAMCGTVGQMWIVKLSSGKSFDFMSLCGNVDEFSIGSTIIESDRGGFLVAGRADVHFAAGRVDQNGRSQWFNKYTIGNRQGQCYSAIELKSGEFLLAGYYEAENDRDGLLIMIDSDGDFLWSHSYGIGAFNEEIRAIKEIGEDGVMVSAVRSDNTLSDLWILMVDYNGEPYFENQLVTQDFYYPEDMASVGNGYGIGGTVVNQDGDTDYFLTKIDRFGAHEYTHHYSILDGSQDRCRGITSMDNNGFVLYGHKDGGALPYKAIRIRVGSGGDMMYYGKDEYRGQYAYYNSAVTVNGATTFCGVIPANDWSRSMGFIATGYKEYNEPQIIWRQPEDEVIKVLQGDEVDFSIGIFDPDRNDRHGYSWEYLQDGDIMWRLVTHDTTATILFDELGMDSVRVLVYDDTLSTNTKWGVEVTDFYVSAHNPDTLFLLVERTDTVDFRMDVRYLGMEVPEFSWLVNGELVSEEPVYRHPCSIPGDYIVEGASHLGDNYDQVIWFVRVKAMLGYWDPQELALTVPRDTTITFRARPHNPDSLRVNCLWTLNRRTRLGMDTVIAVTFPELGHQIIVAAINVGLEIDRIEWDINVIEPPPNSVGDEFAFLPEDPTLTEIYPNPFNSSGRFTYTVPAAGRMKLQLFDMTGRLVKSMVDGFITPGRRTVRIDGTMLPTGLYVLYMEAAGTRISRKAVVMK